MSFFVKWKSELLEEILALGGGKRFPGLQSHQIVMSRCLCILGTRFMSLLFLYIYNWPSYVIVPHPFASRAHRGQTIISSFVSVVLRRIASLIPTRRQRKSPSSHLEDLRDRMMARFKLGDRSAAPFTTLLHFTGSSTVVPIDELYQERLRQHHTNHRICRFPTFLLPEQILHLRSRDSTFRWETLSACLLVDRHNRFVVKRKINIMPNLSNGIESQSLYPSVWRLNEVCRCQESKIELGPL